MKKLLKWGRSPIGTLALVGSSLGVANGALVFTFQEVGGDVVMTSSGSIDTANLVANALEGWGGTGVEENGNTDIIGGTEVGTGLDTSFAFSAGTDFTSWQTGNPWDSSFFAFDTITGSHDFTTYVRNTLNQQVPGLGISAVDLVGSVWTPDQEWIALGESFVSMGLNEGTYTVTDAVSSESITFQIGDGGVVPEPSSSLLAGLAGLTLLLRRRRK